MHWCRRLLASPATRQSGASAIGFDHLVLTVADVETSARFYERVLGMRRSTFDGSRTAMSFGGHKLNLNPREATSPRADPLDFCITVAAPVELILRRVQAQAVRVALGPVERSGAKGPITSIYVRDPDENIVEIATYERD